MSMLQLSLPKLEIWDPKQESFVYKGGETIELEHSLYTIAAWESKWKKPFANKSGLTREELFDYIMHFMCQTSGIPTSSWLTMDQDSIKKIRDYMEDPNTAFSSKKSKSMRGSSIRETVTADLIYFYMTQFGIPFECEHWHLNRLMALIDVCAMKNSSPKKMGKNEAAAMRRAQNARMREKLGSRG